MRGVKNIGSFLAGEFCDYDMRAKLGHKPLPKRALKKNSEPSDA
jgi:hypothetical protein